MSRTGVRLILALILIAGLCGMCYGGAGKPPKNPSTLIATAVSSTQIDLSWVDNATDEDGFRVERMIGTNGTWETLDYTPPYTAGSGKGCCMYYSDTTCDPDTEYCYRIFAFNSYGDSTPSNVACDTTFTSGAPPAAPTNLTATAVSGSQINLAWTDNSSNEAGFKIEVDEGDTGTFVYLDTVGVDVTSYPDTGLSVGVTYCYRVYAYNGEGDSGYSNSDCDVPFSQPPAAPTNLVATAVSETEINLVWTDNSDNETGFKIEVDEGDTGTFVYLDTVGADVTSYPDTGLSEGVSYCYRVYAYNGEGDSAYSNVDCATPQSGQVVTVSTVAELEAAVNAATPGTIIELTDGLYQLTTANGIMIVDKDDLTIRSQSGNREAVVIRGEGISDNSVWFNFKLYNSNYIAIEDMTLKDVYWHCVQINEGSSYYTLRNLYMWDAGEGPVKTTNAFALNGPWCDYGLIEDCVIGYTTQGYRTVVEGIDLIASVGTVISDCQFYNAIANRAAGYGFFVKGNGADTVLENCYAENCDIAYSFGDGLCPPELCRYEDASVQHHRGIMRNNIVHGTALDVGIYLTKASDFKVYNNTVWSTYKFGSSIDFRYLETYGNCYNNIFSQGYRLRDGGTANLSNNIWNAPASLFVDQANGDYHLVVTATDAIDQGLDTTADVPYDMDWEARPKGSAVDIGADEF